MKETEPLLATRTYWSKTSAYMLPADADCGDTFIVISRGPYEAEIAVQGDNIRRKHPLSDESIRSLIGFLQSLLLE